MNSVKWNETRRIGAIFACFYVARVWQRQLGFLVIIIIIIMIIIKQKLKAQINQKTSQMRRDDAATENCRLQCNVNETEVSSTVSENRTVSVMRGGSEFQIAVPA